MEPYEAIEEIFGDEVPSWVIKGGKNSLSILLDECGTPKRISVFARDVAYYYYRYYSGLDAVGNWPKDMVIGAKWMNWL